eukprot:6883119-Prymnesium_polylepis.1
MGRSRTRVLLSRSQPRVQHLLGNPIKVPAPSSLAQRGRTYRDVRPPKADLAVVHASRCESTRLRAITRQQRFHGRTKIIAIPVHKPVVCSAAPIAPKLGSLARARDVVHWHLCVQRVEGKHGRPQVANSGGGGDAELPRLRMQRGARHWKPEARIRRLVEREYSRIRHAPYADIQGRQHLVCQVALQYGTKASRTAASEKNFRWANLQDRFRQKCPKVVVAAKVDGTGGGVYWFLPRARPRAPITRLKDRDGPVAPGRDFGTRRQ